MVQYGKNYVQKEVYTTSEAVRKRRIINENEQKITVYVTDIACIT